MESQRRYTVEEVEAMTSDERDEIIRSGIVMNLSDVGPAAETMLERGRSRLRKRPRQITAR